MSNVYRTHGCGTLSPAQAGEEVVLSGWIHRLRELGGILFVVLRDASGLVQLVIDPQDPAHATDHLDSDLDHVRLEASVRVRGVVRERPAAQHNPEMATGAVEVVVRSESLELLGRAEVLPFTLHDAHGPQTNEQLRLKHRYLDLRRAELQRNLKLRADVIAFLREGMRTRGFTEVQTPILTASSPEGARDYLVPARLHPGKFYALPQAPQQFKQLLMASGVERYFQIAPCFRDEAARADRSPGEFYQLDLEMAFATQEDVFEVVEGLMIETFQRFSDWSLPTPFVRMPYAEAMARYGSDKPDLRFALELAEVTDVMQACTIPFVADALGSGQLAVCVLAPGMADASRKRFDAFDATSRALGSGGVLWLGVREGVELRGGLAKKMPAEAARELLERAGGAEGDAVLVVVGPKAKAQTVAGRLRKDLGHELGLVQEGIFRFCWVVDYPMYERDEETGAVEFSHNPFSMPQGGMEALRTKDPLEILAYQYDLVCNGLELSSGAIRNHRPDVMVEAFGIAGYGPDEVAERFGALYRAFQYGPPPHGGIAPGVERILMLLANTENIRDVVAFPMNAKAQDVMMGAPAPVTPEQLEELSLEVSEDARS